MERFEFDSKAGPNSNRKNSQTCRGAIELFPWEWPTRTLLILDIRGPQGALRGSVVIDPATAAKVGVRLLEWADKQGFRFQPDTFEDKILPDLAGRLMADI